jgi:hypothetical protein
MRLSGDRVDEQVWACLRAYPSRPDAPWGPALPGFWARAVDHGVALLLARQLEPVGAIALPSNAAHNQVALAIRSRAVLAEVLALFQTRQIRCAPLKGPLLAARLYDEFTLRPTTDVDVLLATADLDDALDVLRAAGARPPEPASYRYYRTNHHHVNAAFLGVAVELHFRATSSFGAVIPAEPLLARTTPAIVDGVSVPILDPIDELVCLAVNAAAHRFRGVLLLDIRRLVERSSIDWLMAERRAREWHVARATAAALVAAGTRAGLDVTGIPASWLGEGEGALRRLPALPLVTESYLPQRARDLALQAILADSPARAGRVVLHNVLRPLRRRIHRTWPTLAPWHWSG